MKLEINEEERGYLLRGLALLLAETVDLSNQKESEGVLSLFKRLAAKHEPS